MPGQDFRNFPLYYHLRKLGMIKDRDVDDVKH
jgi:hypothetical protein